MSELLTDFTPLEKSDYSIFIEHHDEVLISLEVVYERAKEAKLLGNIDECKRLCSAGTALCSILEQVYYLKLQFLN